MCVCLCVCVYIRRKSQQAEREYEKVKHQLENLEESVRDRCKKEFTGTHQCGIFRADADVDGREQENYDM